MKNAELQWIPATTVSLPDAHFEIDAWEDDDDVQKVYHNLEATEEQMESMDD